MPNDRPPEPTDTSATPQIVDVTRLPAPLHLYLRALLTSRKPATARALPPLAFRRRNVVLDATDIARYARLCGFSEAHGVPPTWPHLLAFPLHMLLMTDRAFPYAMLGMVHLANRIHPLAPLTAGDRLDIDVQCGALYAHDKGQVFTVLTTAHRDGNLVWRGESLYLRTGVRNALGSPYRAELSAGASLVKSATWQVPGDLGRQYARVSGDYNPIHLWPVTARLFGFSRPIIHGMWSFARALAAVMPADASNMRDLDLLVEFKTPIWLPGEVTFWRDPQSSAFELRDAAGTVPHLRGRWTSASPTSSHPEPQS